jgi:acyl-CoA synthetase (AMP-forming)/AMP-acid ligase II
LIRYILILKGYQVAPSELEQIILTHSEVLDAAVGSIPDESAGELPRAYVVKRPGSILKEADIIEYVEGRWTITQVYIKCL